jgi:hypothetical protein
MAFTLMAGGAFRVSLTQLVSQLEQSEREILKLCLGLGEKKFNSRLVALCYSTCFGPTTPKQFDERGSQIDGPIPLTADRQKLWPASPEIKRRSKSIRSGSRRRKGRSREF